MTIATRPKSYNPTPVAVPPGEGEEDWPRFNVRIKGWRFTVLEDRAATPIRQFLRRRTVPHFRDRFGEIASGKWITEDQLRAFGFEPDSPCSTHVLQAHDDRRRRFNQRDRGQADLTAILADHIEISAKSEDHAQRRFRKLFKGITHVNAENWIVEQIAGSVADVDAEDPEFPSEITPKPKAKTRKRAKK